MRAGKNWPAPFSGAKATEFFTVISEARHGGEVDIVCRDRDTLVFVEVKTRTREDFGRPVEAVNAAKRKLISRGALAWLQLLDNPDILVRFDVVEIILAEDGRIPFFEPNSRRLSPSRSLHLLTVREKKKKKQVQLTIRRRAHSGRQSPPFYRKIWAPAYGKSSLLRARLSSAGVKSPSGPMHIITVAGRSTVRVL